MKFVGREIKKIEKMLNEVAPKLVAPFMQLIWVAIFYNCINCIIQFKLNEIMIEPTIMEP